MVAAAHTSTAMTNPHPNQVDRKRIERALRARKRYRYVAPQVNPVSNGYHIKSPCCSRNIDSAGGIIDIAWLEFLPQWRLWRLYRKDHVEQSWVPWAEYSTMDQVFAILNHDPQRRFWP